jgi:hypothetical protein
MEDTEESEDYELRRKELRADVKWRHRTNDISVTHKVFPETDGEIASTVTEINVCKVMPLFEGGLEITESGALFLTPVALRKLSLTQIEWLIMKGWTADVTMIVEEQPWTDIAISFGAGFFAIDFGRQPQQSCKNFPAFWTTVTGYLTHMDELELEDETRTKFHFYRKEPGYLAAFFQEFGCRFNLLENVCCGS